METVTFTNDEKDRLNNLYVNGFEGITPKDAGLIGRWEAYKATQETEFETRLQAIREENETRLANAQSEYETAMNSLQTLHDAALARLERLG